ncbi:MAG TPA: Hsp33 family molecular chaperone HslO [Polyangia bacterium]|nr:Hsp33 family molecular chaperone HslO [Polyangia bacterium]
MQAPHDHLIRTIARESSVRVAVAVTSDLVADAARRHALSPAATCAVGRALTSGLLLATLTKGGERVTVQLVGDGPIGSITVDATDAGDVRGYAQHPTAGPPVVSGRVRVAETLGRHGVVNVLRDLGLKELYQGQVALVTGEVDEDVEAYLRSSEQVPSALGCEVLLDDAGAVRSSAGVLVQALPGGDPESVREIQHALRTGRLYDLLNAGERSARTLAEQIYVAEPLEVVGAERSVRFQCRCSPERIGDMLKLLTTVDLDEMIADDQAADVICNFCNTHYRIERAELERIRSQIAGGPRQSN